MIRWILTAALLLLFIAPASAQLLMYEGFTYTAGQPLSPGPDQGTTVGGIDAVTMNPDMLQNVNASGFPWNHTTTPTNNPANALVVEGSLTFPGLPSSTGNRFELPRKTQSNVSRITLPGAPYSVGGANKNIFFSFLLQMTDFDETMSDATAGSTSHRNGDFMAGLTASSGGGMSGANVYAGQVRIRRQLVDGVQNQKFELGLVKNNQGTATPPTTALAALAWDTQGFSEGETIFVVGEYQLSTSDRFDDVVRLWINPVPGVAAGIPTLEITDGVDVSTASGAAQSTVSAFWFRDGNTFLPGAMLVDELRVGLSYADVTPGLAIILAGDYNGDGLVDGADYVTWRNALAGNGSIQNETVSIGTIDAADYDEWRKYFGNPAPGFAASFSTAVPEPVALTWWVITLGGWLWLRAKR